MAETNEPRALSAALAAPAFASRGAGLAMHLADRHIERWAPEASAERVRPMRSLGFVDRLISPWIETAQRSASLRLFDQYAQAGFGERPPGSVSWVFPRPWYQDELDWMAAARRAPRQEAALFTTRGTYVAPPQAAGAAPMQAPAMAMPAALYEYVAPSMSIAQPAAVAGVGYGGESLHADAYSPLVPLAAVQAANLMARAVAPAIAPATSDARMSPALRNVLASMLERAAVTRADESSRIAMAAPELVTPPAPRTSAPELEPSVAESRPAARTTAADQVAEHYAAQHARIVELQRIAQRTAERELAARAETDAKAKAEAAAKAAPAGAPGADRAAELREGARRAEQQLREESVARTRTEQQRQQIEVERASSAERASAAERAEAMTAAERAAASSAERATASAAERATASAAERATASAVERATASSAERARLEERAAQRTADRGTAQRLHEQARAQAAEHARAAVAAPPAPAQVSDERAPLAARRPPPEIASAIADLPPELATFIGQRPGRAMQAIEELDVALRTIELIARGAASGTSFEVTRGPRLVMPAGLGGLVAAVERTAGLGADRARAGESPAAAIGRAAPAGIATPAGIAAPAGGAAPAARPFAPALAAAMRVPSLPWLAAAAPRPIGMASAPGAAPAEVAVTSAASSAFAATTAAAPAALAHVAWADRWLARFAGASKPSLDTLAAPGRMESLAASAPGGVFVSPTFDIERDAAPARNVDRLLAAPGRPLTLIPSPAPVIRYADDAETPDDVFASISASATRQRTQPAPVSPAAASSGTASGPASSFAAPSFAASPGAAPSSFRPGAGAIAVEHAERTPADMIAASAPAAPAAGLSAQLASSPFAPALRHILPMPSAPSFDVRSLFSGGLSATYLAGLLSEASHELELAPRALPSWAAPRWAAAGLEGQAGEGVLERAAPGWDAAYVAPIEPGADALAAAGAAPVDADALAAFEAARAAAEAAALPMSRADVSSTEALAPALRTLSGAPLDQPAGFPADQPAGQPAGAAAAAAEAFAAAAAPITTLRTALLSWSAESAPGGIGAAGIPGVAGVLGWVGEVAEPAATTGAAAFAASADRPVTAARAMLESMSLPMLGDVIGSDERGGAWMAPGMIASRAHSWSVAQERSASDLALDFVTPELVLAARVYGLGPSEAAQAARLAIAGSGHLTAMAGTVDRAFIQAMAMDSDRRARLSTLMTAYPVSAAEPAAGATADAAVVRAERPEAMRAEAPARAEAMRAEAERAGVVRAEVARAEAVRAESGSAASVLAEQVPAGTAFGVDRRAPRGAFLWPSASVAALGLSAAEPDGQISMSVAALELLAARAVAELGTYAALDVPGPAEVAGLAGAAGAGAVGAGAAGAGAAGAGEIAGVGGVSLAVGGTGVGGTTGAAAGAAEALDAAALDAAGASAGAAGTADAAAYGAGSSDRAPLRRYPFLAGARRLDGGAAPAGSAPGSLGEPGEREVLAAAGELVAPTRRARFEALYLALGQSTAGRSWSPAARAARALALAGHTEDVPLSARDRAAAAWDVLPVVYASEALFDAAQGAAADGTPAAAAAAAAAASGGFAGGTFAGGTFAGGTFAGGTFAGGGFPGGAFAGGGFAPGPFVTGAPGGRELRGGAAPAADWPGGYVGAGLGALSARAGEALGAYVAPAAAPSSSITPTYVSTSAESSSSREREVGAVLRAPTAMQELVRTGRPAGRHGGGETEIPPWFEAAARKMFESQGSISGDISLAELTLVTSAPSTQIAASTRSAASASPQTPSVGSAGEKAGGAGASNIDIETTAQEIYRYILTMMDVARARNGEPYL